MPLDTFEFGQVMHYYFEKFPEVLFVGGGEKILVILC